MEMKVVEDRCAWPRRLSSTTTYPVQSHKWSLGRMRCTQTLPHQDEEAVSDRPSAKKPMRLSSESKISRTRSQKANVMSNILNTIAQVNTKFHGRDFSSEEKGEVVRLKIAVKKEDLEQVLEALRDGNINENKSQGFPSRSAVLSLEQRLNFMRKRQLTRKANQVKFIRNNSSWMPVLQSIPEEF